MRTANPALSAGAFVAERSHSHNRHAMTVNGAVVKTGILTGILIAAGTGAWITVHPSGESGYDPVARGLFGIAAPIAGFVIALITIFVPRVSPVTAPLYAICEGLFLGAISSFFSEKYAGIALQAGLLTVGVLGLMLLAYVTGVIRATGRLQAGIGIAMLCLCLVYLAGWLLPMAGVTALNPLFQSGPIGIGFSVIVVGLAALNLILDFGVIEAGARAAAPKYMEWYAAFGLLVTLVWLYLELLRLLAKLRSSD